MARSQKIGIIVQARMGSERLPGKVLMEIGSKTLLKHIFDRLSLLKHKAACVLAIPDLREDDVLAAWGQKNKIKCFRGSESDVLERYYLCAQQFRFNQIVRLTGDNPFYDIEELDRLIDLHLDSEADYSNSFESLPVGVGAEIFTFKALVKAHQEGRQPHHREHVNEYMLENPDLFKTKVLAVDDHKRFPKVRLTVDTNDDYQVAGYVAKRATKHPVTTPDAIRLAKAARVLV